MPKAVFKLGLELCDDVDRLTPLMRDRRRRDVDLTASTLTVKGQRLRASLELRVRGDTEQSEVPFDTDVAAVIELIQEWRQRATPTGDLARAAQLVVERGELFIKMLKSHGTTRPDAISSK